MSRAEIEAAYAKCEAIAQNVLEISRSGEIYVVRKIIDAIDHARSSALASHDAANAEEYEPSEAEIEAAFMAWSSLPDEDGAHSAMRVALIAAHKARDGRQA